MAVDDDKPFATTHARVLFYILNKRRRLRVIFSFYLHYIRGSRQLTPQRQWKCLVPKPRVGLSPRPKQLLTDDAGNTRISPFESHYRYPLNAALKMKRKEEKEDKRRQNYAGVESSKNSIHFEGEASLVDFGGLIAKFRLHF